MDSTSAKDKRTVVEEGTNFKGTLSSSCPIDVRGRIEGEIETPSLTVSRSGSVHGRAKVGAVRSEGELSGEFEADSVELAGRVRDNTIIRARSLEVKLTTNRGKMQVIFGECELSVGDEPTEQVMVDEPAPQLEAEAQPAPAPAVEPEPEPLAAAPVPVAAASESEAPTEESIDETMVKADAHEAAAAPAAPEAKPAPTATSSDGALDDLLSAFSQPPAAAPAAQAAEADEDNGKSNRKKRKGRNETEGESGWSQPPSQPPPAASS